MSKPKTATEVQNEYNALCVYIKHNIIELEKLFRESPRRDFVDGAHDILVGIYNTGVQNGVLRERTRYIDETIPRLNIE